MKKFKIISYIILLIVLIILGFTLYTSASQNNEQDSKEKIKSEIEYLDTKISELFNNMNNIETRNYKIYTTKVQETKTTENTNSGNSTKSNSNNDSNSNNSTTENSGETQNSQNYEMKESGVLTSDRTSIDWTSSKNEIEQLYTSISTVTLDLYSLNIAQEDILNFNKEIDNLSVSIEEENKQATLDNLVKIYEYIPKFSQVIENDDMYKTVLETKLNVFKAYSKLDKKDWDGINNDLTEAINIYTTLLTNVQIETNKQASVNKGYVMLNELKNVVETQNDSIFLIKYKNLLEEINNM